jgi:hypothetical protein
MPPSPAGVANTTEPRKASVSKPSERHCRLELCAVHVEEGGEARAAGLLFTLEQDGHVDRQTVMNGKPGAAGLDEGHPLALVVRGAAGDDGFPGTRVLGKTRREGRRGPLLQRIRRLHVVVAVKQHA